MFDIIIGLRAELKMLYFISLTLYSWYDIFYIYFFEIIYVYYIDQEKYQLT